MSQCSWRRQLVRRMKKWLEDRFPLTFPVRVYLRPTTRMEGHLGYFTMGEDADSGIICLRDTLDHDALIETFVEEWAHARTAWLNDEEDHDEDPWHHATFWAEYGRIVKAARERQF